MKLSLTIQTAKTPLCPGCLIELTQQNICFYQGVALCGCCNTAAIYDCRAAVERAIRQQVSVNELNNTRGLLIYAPREKPKNPPSTLDTSNAALHEPRTTQRTLRTPRIYRGPTAAKPPQPTPPTSQSTRTPPTQNPPQNVEPDHA